jgi:tRNA A-37 threonylcarbamoyl transferase component Bud32
VSKDLGKASTLGAVDEVEERPRSDTAVIDDPLLGKLIDERYRIAMRLGQGGMGIVYEARHEILGSRLAFKVLRSDAAGDEEAIERLKREAQAATAIGNEHIVDVRDFGRLEDGSVYIVMELIEGSDLYTLMKRDPIPWQRARDIAIQICEALEAAHQQGIIHRDLKLENVLLTTRRGRSDFVKVVDFGIAKVRGGSKLTAAGRVMGTPEYMSPEQCAGKTVDHRTDIYSLGVMMYEMLTQKLPFWDADLITMIKRQIHEKPVPPSSVRPDLDIPLAFEALVLRLLAKDPDARFQSMRAVKEALKGDEVPEEPKAPATIHDAPAPAPFVTPRATPTLGHKPASRGWIWPAAIAALLAIGLGAGFWVGGDFVRDETPAQHVERTDPEPEPEPEPAPEPAAEVSPPVVVVPPGRSAEIQLTSDPPGARVYEGEALLGETPFTITRPAAGARLALSVRRDGYTNGEVVMTELTSETLHLTLTPLRNVRVPRANEPTSQEGTPDPRPEPEPGQPPRRHQEFLDPWGNPPP